MVRSLGPRAARREARAAGSSRTDVRNSTVLDSTVNVCAFLAATRSAPSCDADTAPSL